MQAYRMIPFQMFDAFTNMALDEVIVERVRSGDSLPTIRFYGWQPSAISIGIFQGIHNEVNLDKAKAAGVDVVRRQTGGGAVYHAAGGEITYSIIGSVNLFPANILKSYEVICGDIVFALKNLGLEAHFAPINDILVQEQKISGSAQTRRNGILLQHGTVLYQTDIEKIEHLLNVSQEKTSDKLIKSVKKRVTWIQELCGASLDDLKLALEQSFSRERWIEIGGYTTQEIEQAGKLVKEKYTTNAWNYRL